jgi:hypothetical protein
MSRAVTDGRTPLSRDAVRRQEEDPALSATANRIEAEFIVDGSIARAEGEYKRWVPERLSMRETPRHARA